MTNFISDEEVKRVMGRMEHNSCFIGGEMVPHSGKFIKKESPHIKIRLPDIAACDQGDVNRAVAIAKNAYDERIWVRYSQEKRKKIILRLADLVQENIRDLAVLDTCETGRAIKNFLEDSIPKAINAIRWFAEAIDKLTDQAIQPSYDEWATVCREPLGVVGIITPWNDPLVVTSWKVIPALLMGNSVILKPAEEASYTAIIFAQLAHQAGVPAGVFNVITGYGQEAGKALALHHQVDGVFFTGSTEVGQLIMTYAGQSNLKKIGLECGGKSSFIISKKCGNIKGAVKVLARNIYYNQGQICSAPSRAIVHKSKIDEVVALLEEEAVKYIPENPLCLEANVGCVVSGKHKERIENFINESASDGAKIIKPKLTSNNRIPSNGVVPVIVTNVRRDMAIVQKEIFGPVICLIPFDEIEDAIEISNDTVYGLAASIWTDDFSEAHYVSRLLQAGIVHINSYGDDNNSVPFGGVKMSGIGKDKSLHVFDEYSNLKTVWAKI